jgi:hypothetical protein
VLQNWVFGVISEDRTYANISPVISAKNKDPTVLQSLAFWVRSALGHQTGFAVVRVRLAFMPLFSHPP